MLNSTLSVVLQILRPRIASGEGTEENATASVMLAKQLSPKAAGAGFPVKREQTRINVVEVSRPYVARPVIGRSLQMAVVGQDGMH
jgi:hypothetical protein